MTLNHPLTWPLTWPPRLRQRDLFEQPPIFRSHADALRFMQMLLAGRRGHCSVCGRKLLPEERGAGADECITCTAARPD